MTRLHKGLIIALAFLILFNLVVGDDWKDACMPAAILVNTWLSAKEKQLSKSVKIADFALVFGLLTLGLINVWPILSKHI